MNYIIKLLPCPFCGGRDLLCANIKCDDEDLGDSWGIECNCYDCICIGPVQESQEEAIRKWNARSNVAELIDYEYPDMVIRPRRKFRHLSLVAGDEL